MEYIRIGKIVNTHGIKGEIRLLSDFKYKEKVFVKDFIIYIGNEKIKEKIVSYRPHKNFDMICLEGYSNINEVLKYKSKLVYINKDDLKLDKDMHLDEDLINLKVIIDDKEFGIVKRIEKNGLNELLVILKDDKEYLVPYVDYFIRKIDLDKKVIIINNIKGLFD